VNDVLLAQAGDTRAFDRLVKNLRILIFRRALKALRSPDEAEDLTQEVLLLAFRKLASFKGESKFSTWIYSITTNCLRMAIRTKSRRRKKENSPEWDLFTESKQCYQISSCYGAVEARNEIETVFKIIDLMSEENQSIIKDVTIKGMSLSDIADKNLMNINSVKTRIHRARKFIKKNLDEIVLH